MPCNATSQLTNAPSVPLQVTMPTNNAQWAVFVQRLQDAINATRDAANRTGVNVVPAAYAVYDAAAIPALSINGASAALDGTKSQFGKASLKLTATAATVTVSFTGNPIAITAYQRWIESVYIQSSRASIAGTLAVVTPSASYPVDISGTLLPATWGRLYGDCSLVADASTQATMTLTLTGCSVGDTFNLEGWQLEQAAGNTNLPSAFVNSAAPGSQDTLPDGSGFVRLSSSHASGNVAYNYRGVWSSATAYVTGDEVVYSGSYWLSLTGNTNSAPAQGNGNWQVVGAYNNYQGAWSSKATYYAGQEATYNGNYWVSTATNTNSAPSTSNANWVIAGPQNLDHVADGESRFAAIHNAATQTGIYAPGANLVYNPMFALGNAGYQAQPWVVYSAAQGGPWAITNLTATPTTSPIVTNKFNCSAGQALSAALEYMIQTALTGGDLSADIQFYTSSGAPNGNSGRIMVATAATSFLRVELANIVAPTGTAYAAMRIFIEAATGSNNVLVRRLKVEYGTTCTPFNDNATQAGNLLTVAGSGQQPGDQRNLPSITWAGVRSVLSASPITYTITDNGNGTSTVNFSVAAVTLYNGSNNPGYAASSGSSSPQTNGTTFTYYLYYTDVAGNGGTFVLQLAASIQQVAQALGNVLLGTATVTVASGGGGTGGSGSGGGGYCVADDMFIGEGRLAGDAAIGDPFDCIDLPTAAGKHVRALQGVSRGVEECVRIVTSDGCALVCSLSTPFDLPDGRNTTAPHMLGEQVITDLGTATVTSLALVGQRPVTRAHLGGVSYAAGADPTHRIYSHNSGIEKP